MRMEHSADGIRSEIPGIELGGWKISALVPRVVARRRVRQIALCEALHGVGARFALAIASSANSAHALFREANGLVNVSGTVLGGDEAGLEGRRSKVDAGVEHTVKEKLEAILVASHDRGEGIRGGPREIDAKHAPDGLRRELDARTPCGTRQGRSSARACARRAARRSRAPGSPATWRVRRQPRPGCRTGFPPGRRALAARSFP